MKHLETIIEDHTTAERICACCGMVLDEKIIKDRGIAIQDNKNKIHWNTTSLSHHDGAMGVLQWGIIQLKSTCGRVDFAYQVIWMHEYVPILSYYKRYLTQNMSQSPSKTSHTI